MAVQLRFEIAYRLPVDGVRLLTDAVSQLRELTAQVTGRLRQRPFEANAPLADCDR